MRKLIAAAVVAGAAAVALFLIEPTGCAFLPACPIHSLTGLYCPGCGSTRALHQLLHGHFLAAFHFNPLLVCLIPLLVALVLCRNNRRVLTLPWAWTLLTMVIAFGVMRNIPVHPFSLLIP